jgi:hypothetical protein
MSPWWLRLVPRSWQTKPLTPDARPASARASVLVTREAHAEMEPEAEG